MVIDMATPEEQELLNRFAGKKPASVAIDPLKPIFGGETPEQITARRAEEGRKGAEETRQQEAARLAQEAADRAARNETRDVEQRSFQRVGELRKEFLSMPEVRDFRNVLNSTQQIVSLAQGEGSAMGDLASIFSYMKTLDPSSTVREGEAASAQNAAGIPERLRNYYNNLRSGKRLSPDQRADMANTAITLYKSRAGNYNSLANTYRGLLNLQGANPDENGVVLAPELTFQPAGQSPAAGTGEGPNVTVTPEDSIATFGQLTYDNKGNLVGRAYRASGGEIFNAQGQPLGLTGTVSEEALQTAAPSFYESALGAVTGADRSTATTERLPDWVQMPGINDLLSSAAWKTGLGTAFGGSPQEIAQIVQANFPGTQVYQDEKGNYILRSAIDGKDYAIKPGFQISDIPRAGNIIGLGLLGGGGAGVTALQTAGREALMQTGIEAAQAGTGGTFNPSDIAMAGVLGGGAQRGLEVLPGAAGRMVGRMMGNAPAMPSAAGIGEDFVRELPGGIPLPSGRISAAPAGGSPMGGTPAAAIPTPAEVVPTGMPTGGAAPEIGGVGGLSSAPTAGSRPLQFSVAPAEILSRSGTRSMPGAGVLDDADIGDRDAVLDALGLPRDRRRLGAQTGNKAQIEDEVMVSKLGEGSERMVDQFDLESRHLGEYALDLIDRTGGTLNLDAVNRGNAIVKPLEDYQAWYKGRIGELYKQADEAAAASGVPITLQGLNDALRVDSTFASKSGLITLRNGVRKYLKEINAVDKTGQPLPLNTVMAEKVRQYLNDNWTPENSAVIGKLKASIDNDVLSALPADVYAAARQMRANYADVFEKPEGLAKILEIDGPEGINRSIPVDQLGDRLTNWAQKNSAQFNNIVKTLENMPTPVLQQQGRQAVGEIRANLLESILKQNVDLEDISQGGDAFWRGSDKSLGKAMTPYKGKLTNLFGPEVADRLETLRVGARILRPVDPNPSGTATASQRLVGKTREALLRSTGGGIGGTLGTVVGGPAGAAVGGIAGERLGAKMVQRAEVAARERAIASSLDDAAKAKQLAKMRARRKPQ